LKTLLLTFLETIPHLSLLFPISGDSNCSHFAFVEPWDVIGPGFEVEDRLPDVGGKVGEVEDLSYSGAGDAVDPGDLGLVFDLSVGE
jgi:hypothetical protein